MSDDKNLEKISDESEIDIHAEMPEYPKLNSSDAIYTFFMILLHMGGQIGGKLLNSPADIPLANLLDSTIEPPITRRRDEWLKLLAEKFEIIRKEYGELKEVIANPERLVTLLLHALPIAVKNHRKEKLNSLANVVCHAYDSQHTYPSNEIRESMELIMLDLVDRLTTTHIYVIKFISENRFTGNRDELYAKQDEFKEFHKNNPSIVTYVLNELETLGLIYQRENPSDKFQPSLMGRWITDQYTGEGRTQNEAEQYIEHQLKKRNTVKIYPDGIISIIYEKELTDFCWTFLKYISDPGKNNKESFNFEK